MTEYKGTAPCCVILLQITATVVIDSNLHHKSLSPAHLTQARIKWSLPVGHNDVTFERVQQHQQY